MAKLPEQMPIPPQIDRIMKAVVYAAGEIPGVVPGYMDVQFKNEVENSVDSFDHDEYRLHMRVDLRRLVVIRWEMDVTKSGMLLPVDSCELDNRELPAELLELNIKAEYAALEHLNPIETAITYELSYQRDWLHYYDGYKRILRAEMEMDITPHTIETLLDLTDGGQNEIVIHRTKPPY